MNKIIWCCWFQGYNSAPWLVKQCIKSWKIKNPTWDFRFLDAYNIREYIPIDDFIDLNKQNITGAALSDIVRIILLYQYGGVWVDATTYCNKSLDTWLDKYMTEGFFAFYKPGPDRLLSSWFLAAEFNNAFVNTWVNSTISYWENRKSTDQYFWFHYLFSDILEADISLSKKWDRIIKYSADGPHSLQNSNILSNTWEESSKMVNWEIPVFKLTYRLDKKYLSNGSFLFCLLENIDNNSGAQIYNQYNRFTSPNASSRSVASLKVSTINLGDHIQIIAGISLQKRFGITPNIYIDRDNEIKSTSKISKNTPILMNGWFKLNRSEWPPIDLFSPMFLGFHIRLFQCPELVGEEAIEYYKKHAPIGCRDQYTFDLLKFFNVDAFISNCITISLFRRLEGKTKQNKIFVVSRDNRICNYLPNDIIDYDFINHYSNSNDFEINMPFAYKLLSKYKNEAKLIITTLLHCALPCIAMGIPVIMFYPINDEAGNASDIERFSTLSKLIKIHNLKDAHLIDYSPKIINISREKLLLIDSFRKMSNSMGLSNTEVLSPIMESTGPF